MSVDTINLRKLLQLFYADQKFERSLLLKDIRDDIAKEKKKKDPNQESKGGGDFYGPFWADVKDHAAGISDISDQTKIRIAKNKSRARLYPLLHNSFLMMWNDLMRWRNEPFEFVPKSVHARLELNKLGATVKIENTVAVKIWDGSHRIIYPYFSEKPAIPEEGARLGFWALHKALPEYRAEDFRIVDMQHRTYFRPEDVGIRGDEEKLFLQKYEALLSTWRKLRAGR